MTEHFEFKNQYNYNESANKVINTGLRTSFNNEASGQPQSLINKVKYSYNILFHVRGYPHKI